MKYNSKEGLQPSSEDIPVSQQQYGYDRVSRSIRGRMRLVETALQEVEKWPLLGSRVTDILPNVLELPSHKVYSLYGKVRREGIMDLMAEDHGKSRFYYFTPDMFRAFAVFCLFNNSAKAKQRLGDHPLADLIHIPTKSRQSTP